MFHPLPKGEGRGEGGTGARFLSHTNNEIPIILSMLGMGAWIIFRLMLRYSLTIFLGAFLLFQVQPLIGKYILPWFGGGPGVWTTCMLFFQLVLLAGYAYAHFSSRFLRLRTQAIVHCLLLLAAIASLPIIPSDHWKPHGDENPT